jgi:hypothetical protein
MEIGFKDIVQLYCRLMHYDITNFNYLVFSVSRIVILTVRNCKGKKQNY